MKKGMGLGYYIFPIPIYIWRYTIKDDKTTEKGKLDENGCSCFHDFINLPQFHCISYKVAQKTESPEEMRAYC